MALNHACIEFQILDWNECVLRESVQRRSQAGIPADKMLFFGMLMSGRGQNSSRLFTE